MNVITRSAFCRDIIEPAPTFETSKEDAQSAISRMVYQVAMYAKDLEDVGKLDGQGQQMAQKIADFAGDEIAKNWK